MNIELLKQDLIHDEGLRTTAYRDTRGYWTIGIGHLLQPQTNNWAGTVWTMEQVDQQLSVDIQVAIHAAQAALASFLNLTDARQRAVANMAFELGGMRLRSFTTFLSLLAKQDWRGAGEDLKTTAWYHEVPNRADRIIALIKG